MSGASDARAREGGAARGGGAVGAAVGAAAGPVASLLSWSALGLAVVVGGGVLAVVSAVCAPLDRRRVASGRVLQAVMRACVRLVPAWDFRVTPPAPRVLGRRTVVVCDGEGAADRLVVALLPFALKWVPGGAFRRASLAGAAWARAEGGGASGAAEGGGGRAAVDGPDAFFECCARWLDRGAPVLIFVGGARSAIGPSSPADGATSRADDSSSPADGASTPVEEGAYRLAIEAGAELLPVAVRGVGTALVPGSWQFGVARRRVAVGMPLPTAGLRLEDVAALRGRARAQLEAMGRRIEVLEDAG